MAHRHLSIAVLTGVLAGVLLGAGAVRTAELTAELILARTDSVRRSQRTNEVFYDMGLTNPGVEDSRTAARTEDTRSEKGLRGAATAAQIARSCQKVTDRSGCLEDALKRALEQQVGY